MKTKSYLLCFISIAVLLISCSNDNILDDYNNTTQSFTHIRVKKIKDENGRSRSVTVPVGPLADFINNYIVFEDNQYYISISKTEAINFGIDAAEYDEVANSIKEGNKLLADIIEEYSKRDDIKSINIYNCNSQPAIDLNAVKSMPTLSEPGSGTVKFPHGLITTIGQEEGSTTFESPLEMKGVSANCFSNSAMIPCQTLMTECWGQVNVASKFGYSCDLYAKIAVSGSMCTVKYRTTDSNGGKCSWYGTNF